MNWWGNVIGPSESRSLALARTISQRKVRASPTAACLKGQFTHSSSRAFTMGHWLPLRAKGGIVDPDPTSTDLKPADPVVELRTEVGVSHGYKAPYSVPKRTPSQGSYTMLSDHVVHIHAR